MANPTSRLVVDLKPDLHDAVTAYARTVEATRRSIVEEALEEYLNARSFGASGRRPTAPREAK